MSYNEQLQNFDTELQTILDTINNLPEVGEDVVLQEKTVTPTKSVQEVTADAGFTGLSKVSVEEIPEEYIVPSGTLNITANGSYDVTEKAGVVVSVEAPTPSLQSKTVTPTTSQQEVTADSGYDGLGKVTVHAMPTATQATPSISVSTDGLITASATQSAGYVPSGTKSATKQLTTKGATTITPSASDQTAVASGVYTTGAVTVKGDTNLKAENIKKDVSIFGVTGTLEESGSVSGNLKGLIDGTKTSLTAEDFSGVEIIRDSFCKDYTELTRISLPVGITRIGSEAFYGCTNLTSVNLNNSAILTELYTGAFNGCTKLVSITIPASVGVINNNALKIGSSSRKATITMKSTSPPTITKTAFYASYLNKIVVPNGCGSRYKSATNWSKFADYIVEATS